VPESLTHKAFTQYLGTKFQVRIDTGTSVDLTLIEASELKMLPGQEHFSILFRGPSEVFLGQGTFLVEHEDLGRFALFVVPMRQDEQGYYYEAVFNRLVDPVEAAG
jgi:hypothetical protein